ncbi:LysR family transcriptional regulator [Xanthobacter sp. YC-JY1]|uniref:LysR family transcriptional regulator n=1 Tax=Xanthobacter sp. YC-JY1 TaxID=2419844 RepID=UPI001AC50AA6|nr:LysR family transcriptional regulator [Xanthobacter sp. YC-JY1]MBN8917573.1 LysR family transcriptional regulator [Hyphomicrobiales bacterium]UJX46554.1 LysR family transcriptional regulator [Xanthobacter sp. YC-JY1]
MIPWDDFRLVRAIAETGSLAGAAEQLAVNHSTVFRRLGTLEQQLGARLFERARAGYVPTPMGEEMVRLAEHMADEVLAVERRITGQDLRPSGELRVTTNDTLLVHMLTPIFASFRAAYPEIRLDVVISNQSLSLSKRDADVAIRASDRPGDTLVGRRMASIAWGIYGSATQDISGPLDPADLRRHDWIGFSDNLGAIKPAKWLRERVGEEKIIYRVNTVLGLAEAAAAGIGLALLPCFIAAVTPGLVQLMGRQSELESGLWLLTHPDIKATARVRTFMEHAGREIGKLRGRIEGIEDQPAAAAG